MDNSGHAMLNTAVLKPNQVKDLNGKKAPNIAPSSVDSTGSIQANDRRVSVGAR